MFNQFEPHVHVMHKEAVIALKQTAKSMGLSYSLVKRRFTVEQDLAVTKRFWEIFHFRNDVDASGIDYCRGCRKFTVHILSN